MWWILKWVQQQTHSYSFSMSLFFLRTFQRIGDGQGRQWLRVHYLSWSCGLCRLECEWACVSSWAYVRLSIEVSLCWLNPGSVKSTAFFWHPRLPPLLHLSLLPWYNTDVSLCSLSRSFQPLTSPAVIHFPSLNHSKSRPFKYWEMIKVYSVYLIMAIFSIAVMYGWSMHLWWLNVNFGCWQQGFNHNYWIKNNNNKSIEKKHCFFSNSPKSMLKYKVQKYIQRFNKMTSIKNEMIASTFGVCSLCYQGSWCEKRFPISLILLWIVWRQ